MDVMQMTDSELLSLLDTDAERGLAALISQYGGYVKTIVKSKLTEAPAEDIEETVSDVFIAFWQWRRKHTGEAAHLRAVLAVIAKRTAVSRFLTLTKQPPCDSIELLPEPADYAQPDENVMLMQAVTALGEPDSEIVLRRYFFGQSSREIGSALSLTPNTVDQKLSRALKKLRGIWKGE